MVSTRRRILVTSLGVLVAAAVLATVTGVFASKVQPGTVEVATPKVPDGAEVVKVALQETPDLMSVVGTVRSRSDAAVSSKVTSQVRRVHVRAGDRVKRGQLLVELDARELMARRSVAAESLRAATANLTLAKQEHERVDQLRAHQVLPEQDWDVAEARLAAARARVAEAEQRLAASGSVLDDTRVTAPSAGVVIERHVEPGDLALPGRPLVTVYDPESLRLEALVRESYLSQVTLGATVAVEIEAVNAQLRGTIEEVVPQADAATRTFVVKIGLPSTAKLYPGMFGRAQLSHGTVERLLVPAAAVRQIGQVNLLEVVNDDATIDRRQVALGQRFEDTIEVLSGLPRQGSLRVLLRK